MQYDSVVPLVSAAIALIAALSSLYFYRKTLKAQDRAHTIAVAGWKQQYVAQLQTWTDEASDVLAEAVHLCELDPAKTIEPSFFNRRHIVRIRLSSLIDRGRWFFPNDTSTGYGDHKLSGFKGFRDEILDPLVDSYRLIGALDFTDKINNEGLRQKLVVSKKQFVSSAQIVLDPWSTSTRLNNFRDIRAEIQESKEVGRF
jgi:hypothetical protein